MNEDGYLSVIFVKYSLSAVVVNVIIIFRVLYVYYDGVELIGVAWITYPPYSQCLSIKVYLLCLVNRA